MTNPSEQNTGVAPARQFIQKVSEDVALREQVYAEFKQLTPGDWAGLAALGARRGYQFTGDELKQILGPGFYEGRRAAWKPTDGTSAPAQPPTPAGDPGTPPPDLGDPAPDLGDPAPVAPTGGAAPLRLDALVAPGLAALPESVVDATARARLLGVARTLPPFSGVGLELHLNADAPRTDLAVQIKARENGWLLETSHNAGAPWQPIANLADMWQAGRGLLAEGVQDIFLEYDLDRDGVTLPAVHLDIDGERRLAADERIEVIMAALDVLHPTAAALYQHLARIAAVVGNESTYFLGVLLNRPTDAVRLCLRQLPPDPDRIGHLLENLGWQHDKIPAVAKLVQGAQTAGSRHIALAFDVLPDGFAPRLGVELYADGEDSAHWAQLFSWLQEQALCTQAQRDAILAWPALMPVTAADQPGLAAHVAWHGAPPRRLIRRVNHVKLAVDENGRQLAKAYLYLAYA